MKTLYLALGIAAIAAAFAAIAAAIRWNGRSPDRCAHCRANMPPGSQPGDTCWNCNEEWML